MPKKKLSERITAAKTKAASSADAAAGAGATGAEQNAAGAEELMEGATGAESKKENQTPRARGVSKKQFAELNAREQEHYEELKQLILNQNASPQMLPAAIDPAILEILDHDARLSQNWHGVGRGATCLELLEKYDPERGARAREYVEQTVLPAVDAIKARKEAKRKAKALAKAGEAST